MNSSFFEVNPLGKEMSMQLRSVVFVRPGIGEATPLVIQELQKRMSANTSRGKFVVFAATDNASVLVGSEIAERCEGSFDLLPCLNKECGARCSGRELCEIVLSYGKVAQQVVLVSSASWGATFLKRLSLTERKSLPQTSKLMRRIIRKKLVKPGCALELKRGSARSSWRLFFWTLIREGEGSIFRKDLDPLPPPTPAENRIRKLFSKGRQHPPDSNV
ncbi:MAG: hypothetical protein PHV42_02995 [Candidatus Pacebacteria bacterium]|nr:hypothetical protein [Candidatus Paceibacterota bacterium]